MRSSGFALGMVLVALLLLGSCAGPLNNSHSTLFEIHAFAGTGSAAYNGDGGEALQAALSAPADVVFDAAQNLYVADWANHAVRRVDVHGRITTVVGTGTLGYTGDGGPAVKATLNNPNSVAVDRWGRLYIADWGNNVVRRVDLNGVISTIVGTGAHGNSGDGGLATLATLDWPTGIAVDSLDNLYVSDSGNLVIRKVSPEGIISTYAGTGVYGNSGDAGPATAAKLGSPSGLTVSAAGELYFCDYNFGVIRKVAADGTISTIAGTGVSGFDGDGGPAVDAMFNNPNDLAWDSTGNLFVADTLNQRIRVIDRDGKVETLAGDGDTGAQGDGGLAKRARLDSPAGVATDHWGNLLVADQANNVIRQIFLFSSRPTESQSGKKPGSSPGGSPDGPGGSTGGPNSSLHSSGVSL